MAGTGPVHEFYPEDLGDPAENRSGGPWQVIAAEVEDTVAGGPWQAIQNVGAGQMGNIEGRSNQEFTRPGGLGVQVGGVDQSERETVNLVDIAGLRWVAQDNPGADRTDLMPAIDGLIELATFAIDATGAPATYLAAAPTGPTYDGVIPYGFLVRSVNVSGITSHPDFSLGTNTPNWNDVVAAKTMSFAGPDEARFEEATPGTDVAFVPNGAELRLNHSAAAVATNYDVEVVVYGQALYP